MSESAPTETSEQPAIDGEPTDNIATDVDWDALWDEFGFDSPDAAGNDFVSNTHLSAALESSDQSVTAPAARIEAAVNNQILIKRQTAAGALRGYTLIGGDR